jgi:hypothetical protein
MPKKVHGERMDGFRKIARQIDNVQPAGRHEKSVLENPTRSATAYKPGYYARATACRDWQKIFP